MKKSAHESHVLANPIATSKWGAMVVVMLGVICSTLDTTIVNVALPSIALDFHTTVNGVAWVVLGYSVTMTVLTITLGRMSERVGFRALYVFGFAAFTIGSIACALSPNLPILVASRALQAAGGAAILSIGGAVLVLTFPAEQRGRALGMIPIAVALGISTGPVVGGIITQHASWHWVFWVTVPIGLVGIFLTFRFLHRKHDRTSFMRDINWPSLGMIGAFCFTMMVGLSLPLEAGFDWTHPVVLTLLGASPLLLVAFILIDRKQARPLIPFSVLGNPIFTWSVLSGAVSMILVFSVVYLINFQMQRINGFEKDMTGFVLVTSPIMLSTWGPLSGWFSDKVGARLPRLLGIFCAGAGVLWMGTLTHEDGPWQVVQRLALFATGMGLFQTPNNKITYDAIPQATMAHVSSFNACIRMFCTAIGTAAVTAILSQNLRIYLGGEVPNVADLVATPETEAAFQMTFISMIAAAALMLIFALLGDRAAKRLRNAQAFT